MMMVEESLACSEHLVGQVSLSLMLVWFVEQLMLVEVVVVLVAVVVEMVEMVVGMQVFCSMQDLLEELDWQTVVAQHSGEVVVEQL